MALYVSRAPSLDTRPTSSILARNLVLWWRGVGCPSGLAGHCRRPVAVLGGRIEERGDGAGHVVAAAGAAVEEALAAAGDVGKEARLSSRAAARGVLGGTCRGRRGRLS